MKKKHQSKCCFSSQQTQFYQLLFFYVSKMYIFFFFRNDFWKLSFREFGQIWLKQKKIRSYFVILCESMTFLSYIVKFKKKGVPCTHSIIREVAFICIFYSFETNLIVLRIIFLQFWAQNYKKKSQNYKKKSQNYKKNLKTIKKSSKIWKKIQN